MANKIERKIAETESHFNKTLYDNSENFYWLLEQLRDTREALDGLSFKGEGECWCKHTGRSKHTEECLAARKALGIGE